MFDFGIFILTPVYNLSYFLIGMYFGLINYSIQKGINNIYKVSRYTKYFKLKEVNQKNGIEDENNDNRLTRSDENSIENNKYEINNNGKDVEGNLDKDEDIFVKKNDTYNIDIQDEKSELSEQLKNMPFLKTPIQFLNFNKKKKDSIWYNILIFLAIFVIIILCYTKLIFVKANSQKEENIKAISLENVISDITLNIINILDVDIVVFLSHWIIFILFFKELNKIRGFCNSIYWSFFVKSYFSYILISAPVVLCILYESESVIKLHIYNIISKIK